VKLAVTGASGIQGMSAMIYLLEQEDVKEIQVSDNSHMERLRERVDKLNDKRLILRQLDCTDQKTAVEAFKGCEVVINCAYTPGRYLNTMKAALEAGANYLDLTSMG
jgi:saccharopine dehydrogenase-like NADP-dependent oxidoreductase